MFNLENKIYEVDSFTLCIAHGQYQSFSKVDNKGEFYDFYKTVSTDSLCLHLKPDVNRPIYALYKRFGSFFVLICAFENKDEICHEAMQIINSSEELKTSLQNCLKGGDYWVNNK
ncbi:hypothetical protein [Rouxiella chamberiensis]|uniref:Uncharacterized protein n=1 Tax=Rouxiella chamberiensis TaxID=1513468 RepID=A0ABY7HQP6_9GAMM|nr:hypothetical protein [Rouxiella chamberiensis]WAT01495.1 hypothetical protein O1V66_01535 [Rouxiella chamberiensis]